MLSFLNDTTIRWEYPNSVPLDWYFLKKEINRKYGRLPGILGKKYQEILTYALEEKLGTNNVIGQLSEGIDLEFRFGGRALAIEIKTSEGDVVTITEDNLKPLRAKGDDVSKLVGALNSKDDEGWSFKQLSKKELSSTSLGLDIYVLRAITNRSARLLDLARFCDDAFKTSAPAFLT